MTCSRASGRGCAFDVRRAGGRRRVLAASNNVTPGVLGFLVFAAMAVALVFLLRSMNKQFRKITPKAEGAAAANAAAGSKTAPASRPRRKRPSRTVPAVRGAKLSEPLVSVGAGAIGSTSCG